MFLMLFMDYFHWPLEVKASGLSTEGGFGRRARNGTCNLYLKLQAKDYDI